LSERQFHTIEQMAETCGVPGYRVRYLLQRFGVLHDTELDDDHGYRCEVLDWIQAEIRSVKDTPRRRDGERQALDAHLERGGAVDAGDPEMSDELRDDLMADSQLGIDRNRARWAKMLTPPARTTPAPPTP